MNGPTLFLLLLAAGLLLHDRRLARALRRREALSRRQGRMILARSRLGVVAALRERRAAA